MVRVEQSERLGTRHSLQMPGTVRESSPAVVIKAPSVPTVTGGDKRPLKSSVSRETTEEEELREIGQWDSQGGKTQKKSLTAGAVGLMKALSPRQLSSSPLKGDRDSDTQGESKESVRSDAQESQQQRKSQSFSTSVKGRIQLEKQKGGSRQDLYCSVTALPQNSPSVAAVAALKSTRTPIHQIPNKALVVIFCPSNFHFLRMNRAGEVEATMSTKEAFQPDAVFTLRANGDGSYRFHCKFWKKYLWGKLDVVDSASTLFLRKKKDLEKLCLSSNGVVMAEGSCSGPTESAALHVLPLRTPPP